MARFRGCELRSAEPHPAGVCELCSACFKPTLFIATGLRGSGVNRNFSIACASVVLNLATACQIVAQDRYEFRFAFGTSCG